MGAFVLAALFAVGLADAVYRIPIQPWDVVDIVQYTDDTPDVFAAFALGLRASRTQLRPLRHALTKGLLQVAHATGEQYHVVFRGVHAALAAALVLLFANVARPRTWYDVAALALSLTVLLGLHTFLGIVREAFPISQHALVTICALLVVRLAQGKPGFLSDACAVLCVAGALLTIESGVLVPVVAGAAYIAGWRGVSRRGLMAIACVVLAYGWLRMYLGVEVEPFGEHPTGFGVSPMTSEEQIARFGRQPWLLYAYNVASAGSTLLLSQPRSGMWTIVPLAQQSAVPPWMAIQILSSAATTAFLIWVAARRTDAGPRRWRDPYVIVPALVIATNAMVSFAYAKEEIVSTAGVFYALAVYGMTRASLAEWPHSRAARGVLVTGMVTVAVLWSARVAGIQYLLRQQAFNVRNDWAVVRLDDRAARSFVPRLRDEALGVRTLTPRAMPRWIPEWFGEL